MTTVRGRLTESRRNESWERTKAERVPSKQESKILCHLEYRGAMTSRQLAEQTGIERTSVVRALFYLTRSGNVDDSLEVRCPVSGRNVTQYRFVHH